LRDRVILDGLKNDFDLFIDKLWKKENKNKESFQSWKNIIISKIRNKIYSNLKNINNKLLFYNSKIKQAIDNLKNEFVIVPVDEAHNNFVIICQKLFCDILKREWWTTNVYEKVNIEEENLTEKTEEILFKNFNIKINNNDKTFSFLYWTVKFHKNLPKPRFIAGTAKCPTRIAGADLSLILKEIVNKLKIYFSGIKKFIILDLGLICKSKLWEFPWGGMPAHLYLTCFQVH